MGNMHASEYARLQGKERGFETHMRANFFPPHPEWVIQRFLDAFKKYWEYNINLDGLTEELSDIYSGDWNSYGFANFLNEEDLIEY